MAKKQEPKSRGKTLGATYRAASTGTILATPGLGAASRGGRTAEAVLEAYKSDARPFAMGLVVHTVDQVLGQKILGHNSALGRGSVTAWAAEAIPTARAVQEGLRGGYGFGSAAYTRAKTGYNPTQGFSLNDDLKAYGIGKIAAGVVRKISGLGIFRPVAEPVKRALGSAGAAL